MLCVHAAAAADENCPAAQEVHVDAAVAPDTLENRPAVQPKQSLELVDATEAEYVPAAQLVHPPASPLDA